MAAAPRTPQGRIVRLQSHSAAQSRSEVNVLRERFLSVAEVAEVLGTTERFPRRLIAERRITFVKVGRHVRIPESALTAYVEAHTVQPIQPRRRHQRRAA